MERTDPDLRRQDSLTPYSDPRDSSTRTKTRKQINEYLPQTFGANVTKSKRRAMIHAIEKRLKTRGIMRSLENLSWIDDHHGGET
ncbi:hypothetical protein Tco_1556530 [Tanacetum coccineum]